MTSDPAAAPDPDDDWPWPRALNDRDPAPARNDANPVATLAWAAVWSVVIGVPLAVFVSPVAAVAVGFLMLVGGAVLLMIGE